MKNNLIFGAQSTKQKMNIYQGLNGYDFGDTFSRQSSISAFFARRTLDLLYIREYYRYNVRFFKVNQVIEQKEQDV